MDEAGRDARNGDILIRIDPCYFRPTEAAILLGDPSKAHRVLGWRHKVGFRDLVTMMVKSDFSVVVEESVDAGRKNRSGE